MINWNQFTIDNGAITDLRELMFLTTFQDADINMMVTNRTGVKNGKKLGFINDMGEVGLSGGGCHPTYSQINITGIEKEWELGDWEIAKSICYKELEETIAEDSLNTGTDIAYLQDTPYWDTILMPLLQRAIKEMYWRIVWFGDKNAANVADGGVVTDGTDVKLFNMADGLWKRLAAIQAANPAQTTAIAANQSASAILQKTDLRKSGVAIGIMDSLLSDADSRIFYDDEACVFMTSSLFKALRNDIVDKYGKTTMPFENVFAGVQMSEYDGVKIYAVDIWDRMIRQYESDGTKLNNPHRAVCCSPRNLFVGTTDVDKVAKLSITFDDRERDNLIYSQSNIGTLIGEDSLVQVAI